jgi:predicted DNA-binding protein (UPF0251 family)|uniref:Secreted protein n=1 Tax=Populus trichocarpa TaxID=3694 RepID=U5G1R8_POPTR
MLLQLIFLLLQCAVKVIETQDSIQINCVCQVCHISPSTFELLMTSLLEKLQEAVSDGRYVLRIKGIIKNKIKTLK